MRVNAEGRAECLLVGVEVEVHRILSIHRTLRRAHHLAHIRQDDVAGSAERAAPFDFDDRSAEKRGVGLAAQAARRHVGRNAGGADAERHQHEVGRRVLVHEPNGPSVVAAAHAPEETRPHVHNVLADDVAGIGSRDGNFARSVENAEWHTGPGSRNERIADEEVDFGGEDAAEILAESDAGILKEFFGDRSEAGELVQEQAQTAKGRPAGRDRAAFLHPIGPCAAPTAARGPARFCVTRENNRVARDGVLIRPLEQFVFFVNALENRVAERRRNKEPAIRANQFAHAESGLLNEIAAETLLDAFGHSAFNFGEMHFFREVANRLEAPATLFLVVDGLRGQSPGGVKCRLIKRLLNRLLIRLDGGQRLLRFGEAVGQRFDLLENFRHVRPLKTETDLGRPIKASQGPSCSQG